MNRMTIRAALAASAAVAILAQAAFGQVYRYNQTAQATGRYDAQRTGWVRGDGFISPEGMKDFGLVWSSKLDNAARGGGALSAGVTGAGSIGVTVGYIGASDNRTIGVDMDFGNYYFSRSYGPSATPTGDCLPASLATPAKAVNLNPTAPTAARTRPGQADNGPNTQLAYSSAIGGVGEGIPPIKPGAMVAGTSFNAPAGAPVYTGTPESYAAALAFSQNAVRSGNGGVGFGAGGGGRAAAPAGAQEGGVAAPAAGGAPAGAGRAGAPGAPAAPGAAAGAAAAGGLGGGGGGRGAASTYALANDGQLHFLTTNYGYDAAQPVPFIPTGAQASDLTLVNGVIYTTTQKGCGGAANGVWSVRPVAVPAGAAFPAVTSWKTGGTASPSAIAFNQDGNAFVAVSSGSGSVSDAVVALDPATLAVKSSFSQPGANFANAPVIFRVDNRDLLAVQAADGRIMVLDAGNLAAGPLATSPAVAGLGGYKPQPLGYWQDSSGQRWLLATTASSLVAWKLTMNGAAATLTQGWTLAGLKAPTAPLVVNGMVFVASSGQYVPAAGATATAAQLASRSTPAALQAVNGMTGAKVWDSGKTITGFVPLSSQLWYNLGLVMVGDYGSKLYAFGLPYDRTTWKAGGYE